MRMPRLRDLRREPLTESAERRTHLDAALALIEAAGQPTNPNLPSWMTGHDDVNLDSINVHGIARIPLTHCPADCTCRGTA